MSIKSELGDIICEKAYIILTFIINFSTIYTAGTFSRTPI